MRKGIIKSIVARQVYDSRANPTVEVDVLLENDILGRGIVPSGASKGQFEALELRDGDKNRLNGKSVFKAINNIKNIIAPRLIGMDVTEQKKIDRILIQLDSTENKSKLGANAILGVSMAVAWAGANVNKLPLFQYLGGEEARLLPTPMIQIIGGGAHANQAIDLQDFLVIPMNSTTFAEAYEMVVNVYQGTKKIFDDIGKPLGIADEGGLWPTGFIKNEDGLELLMRGIEAAGYVPGEDIAIALDIASSEFYNPELKKYVFNLENKTFNSEEFVKYLCHIQEKYPVISIEDGMAEEDWEGHQQLSDKLKNKIQLIGDDLFTTNIKRIKKGVQSKINNSVLIKMNQIGTLSETLEVIQFTKESGYLPVISARSGETEDATITHLAVATNAGQLKVGSVARTDRTAKWNEAIRIEEKLGQKARYLGRHIFDFIKQ
jgi:enolase